MAKKSTKTSADPVGEPAAPRSNSAVVREILDSGVTKPSEIAEIALQKYELNISLGLINAAKMAWKKKQGGSAKIDKTPKAAAKKPADELEVITIGNGRVTELELAKLALKMGGVQNAIDALTKLLD